jgi:hypothetical protein
MKRNSIAQLGYRVASRQRISVSALLQLPTRISLALICAAAVSAHANIITVTDLNDSGPGSLRQAVADASDGDTINFAVGGTISLTSGELVIARSVAVTGQTQSITVARAQGAPAFRIFHVMPGQTVTIDRLHIAGGDANLDLYGGGVLNDHANLTISNCSLTTNSSTYGGAISSDGSGGSAILAVLDSSVSGNYASYAGGGIYNDASNDGSATASLMNSTVSGNTAAHNGYPAGGGEGGGIYNSGGTLIITNGVVNNNLAGVPDPFPLGDGGGVCNFGTLTIISSSISGNQAYLAGGGILAGGTVTITSSTVSGNAADGQHDGQPWGHGGGISGSVTLTNSTLSSNCASLYGGGIDGGGAVTNSTISGNNGGGISVSGTLEIDNTVMKAGASGPNIVNSGGTVISHGYNLSSDDGGGYLTGSGDQINTDPMLGPLQDNGGPTFTHAPLPGSPAIDAGDPNFTPPPSYDQRDSPFVRVFNGRIDIGSFEVQPLRRASPTPRPRPSRAPRP